MHGAGVVTIRKIAKVLIIKDDTRYSGLEILKSFDSVGMNF